MHHRLVPRRRLRRDRARAGARGGDASARTSRLARVPAAQEPHLHGSREAPRLLHDAGADPSRPALRRCGVRRGAQGPDRRRRHQHAVHLGHDGLPQRRHAHEPQHPQQRLLHRRAAEVHLGGPRLPAGAVLPLLRHRARRARGAHPRRDDRGGRELRSAARARGGAEGEGDRALRRADDVHRRARPPHVRHVRPHVAAHRDHGGLAVPHRDDAPGHRQDARLRDDDRLRAHRGLAGLHADDHRRLARAQVRDGGAPPRRDRGASGRSRDGRGLPRRAFRASCCAAATTS